MPVSRSGFGWLLLAFACLSAIVHIVVYLLEPGKRDNAPLVLFMIGMALLALFACALSLTMISERGRTLAARLASRLPRGSGLLCGAGGIAVMFVFGLVMRPEWIYAHLTLTLAAILGLMAAGAWKPPTDGETVHARQRTNRLIVMALILLMAIVTVIRARALDSEPFIDVQDEGWTLGWAVSGIRDGVMSDTIMLGIGNIGKPIPEFYNVLGVWLRVTGIGLWQARLFSLLLSLPVIAFSARAAYNYDGRRAAILTAIALLASAVLAFSARIRHDIGLAVFVAASLWLHSEAIARGGRRWMLHGAAGVAMGLGLFSHYHALLFAPVVMFALYAPTVFPRLWRERRLPPPGFWAYGIGALLTIAVVMFIQVGGDLEILLGTSGGHVDLRWSHLLPSFGAHLTNVARQSQLEFLLIVIALTAAVWRAVHPPFAARDWTLILGVIGCHLLLAPVYYPLYYYVVPITPFYGLLIGLWIANGFRRLPERPPLLVEPRSRVWPLWAGALALVALLGSVISVPLRIGLSGAPPPPIPAAARWVYANLPLSARVVSDNVYYLSLWPYRFGSALIPEFVPLEGGAPPPMDVVWDRVNADAFIVDPTLSNFNQLGRLQASGYMEERGYRLAARVAGYSGEADAAEIWIRD